MCESQSTLGTGERQKRVNVVFTWSSVGAGRRRGGGGGGGALLRVGGGRRGGQRVHALLADRQRGPRLEAGLQEAPAQRRQLGRVRHGRVEGGRLKKAHIVSRSASDSDVLAAYEKAKCVEQRV